MSTYVILGATGHTGKPITFGLLEKHQTVRIISRHAENAADLIQKGAQHFEGDSSDAAFLKKVFSGADALYTLIPFDPLSSDFTQTQVRHVHAITEALRTSSIKHVVTLSSVGAHLKSNAGVVQGLQKMEEQFNTLAGIDILHLRAAYFLENTLSMVEMVKHMGFMGTPVRADLKVPMVATQDIAATALKHLLALDFSGKKHEYVLGNKEYTYADIAAIYGRAIGKPDLKYTQLPYDAVKQSMMQMGMGESAVDKINEFVKSMNEGSVLADAQRTPHNTTPTSAEEFASVFKSMYEK
ncbi:MAG TPA: NmrA family NAD(P)-binding protein [Bacteroidota bacterium]|nr:NmrA family NAD(P)-binding protein [Bacteroidota bacterium]